MFACLCLIFVLGGIPLGSIGGSSGESGGSDETRGPPSRGALYVIDGNADLLSKASANGWTGTGTESDPITIEGLNITRNDHIMNVSNTDLHVLFFKCNFISTSSKDAFFLTRCTNLEFIETTFNTRRNVINANIVSHLLLQDCIFTKGNIYVSDSDNMTINGVCFAPNSYYSTIRDCSDISIEASRGGSISFSNTNRILIVNTDEVDFDLRGISYIEISRNRNASIDLSDSEHISISRNEFNASSFQIWSCDWITLNDNVFKGSRSLIDMSSQHLKLYDNEFYNCAPLIGSYIMDDVEIPANNSVDGLPIRFYKDNDPSWDFAGSSHIIFCNYSYYRIEDVDIIGSLLPITLIKCKELSLKNINITNSCIGIYGVYCDKLTVERSGVRSDMYSIKTKRCDDMRINQCHLEGGLDLWSSSRFEFLSNDVNNSHFPKPKTLDVSGCNDSFICDNLMPNTRVEVSSFDNGLFLSNRISFLEIHSSNYATVSDNIMDNGLRVMYSPNIWFKRNTIINGTLNLEYADRLHFFSNAFLKGGLIYSASVTDTEIAANNTVGGLPILYFYHTHNNNISIPFGQLILDYSEGVTVFGQNIKDSFMPIQIFESTSITLKNCVVENSTDPVKITDSHLTRIENCKFIGNDEYGVSITSVNYKMATVIGSLFQGSDFGLKLSKVYRSEISRCIFKFNDRGLFCDRTSEMVYDNNTFMNNTDTGLYLYGTISNKCVFRDNIIMFNDAGMKIYDMDRPSVSCNLFFKNNIGCDIHCTNSRINDNIFAKNGIWGSQVANAGTGNNWSGNYWYGWTSPDENTDGIVDAKYNFTGGFDLSPLVAQPIFPISPPMNLNGSEVEEGVLLTWDSPLINRLPFNPMYEMIKVQGIDPPAVIGTTTELTWIDGDVEPEVGILYYVRAFFDVIKGSESEFYYYNKERIPPIINFQSPIPGSATNIRDVQVRWRSWDNQSGLDLTYISFDGEEWKIVFKNVFDLSNLTEGAHSFAVMVYDRSGNRGTAYSNFTVDFTEPSIIYPPEGEILYTNSKHFLVSANVTDLLSGIETWEFNVDETEYFKAGREFYIDNLTEGWHKLSFRATDRAANINETDSEIAADYTLPILNLITPKVTDFYENLDIEIKWECSDTLSGIDRIELICDNITVDVTGETSHWIRSLKTGPHPMTLVATDKSGNKISRLSQLNVGVGPYVLDYSPSGEGVALTSIIRVTMNKEIGEIEFRIAGLNGSTAIDGNGASFTPEGGLEPVTPYEVYVSGFDKEGFGFGPFSWNFTTSGDGRIKGTVTDKDGVELDEVEILDNGSNIGKAENGEFDLSLDPGNHKIQFYKLGYITHEVEIDLAAGEVKELNIELEKIPIQEPKDQPQKESDLTLFIVIAIAVIAALILLIVVLMVVKWKNKREIPKSPSENEPAIVYNDLYGNVPDLASYDKQKLPAMDMKEDIISFDE